MKHLSSVSFAGGRLTVTLDQASPYPVHRQIAQAIKSAVISGSLALGQMLPSMRRLAEALGVSRSTVQRAYEDLLSQGYIETTHGAGSRICRARQAARTHPLVSPPVTQSARPLSSYAESLLSVVGSVLPCVDYQCELRRVDYQCELCQEPDSLVQQYLHLLEGQCQLSLLQEAEKARAVSGLNELRSHYLSYLRRARAVDGTEEQVFVFSGKREALDTLCRILVDPGDCVAVENPTAPHALKTLMLSQAQIVPVPVDRDGMDVDWLTALPHRIKVLYLSPSCHKPSGAVLSSDRRRALVDWAEKNGTAILEDDTYSEFTYGRSLTPALQREAPGGFIYLSTLPSGILPLAGHTFVVVPHSLLAVLMQAKRLTGGEVPLLNQLVLTELIRGGHFERSIRSRRNRYEAIRAHLMKLLPLYFGSKINLSPALAGTEITFSLTSALTDDAVIACAQAARLGLRSTRSHYLGVGKAKEFVLSFAGLDEHSIEHRVRRFVIMLNNQVSQKSVAVARADYQASALYPIAALGAG
ncbi:MAG TPA: PLP-dependent aminotransferase family protein [Candidatus Obscuribacterales bacterium]